MPIARPASAAQMPSAMPMRLHGRFSSEPDEAFAEDEAFAADEAFELVEAFEVGRAASGTDVMVTVGRPGHNGGGADAAGVSPKEHGPRPPLPARRETARSSPP